MLLYVLGFGQYHRYFSFSPLTHSLLMIPSCLWPPIYLFLITLNTLILFTLIFLSLHLCCSHTPHFTSPSPCIAFPSPLIASLIQLLITYSPFVSFHPLSSVFFTLHHHQNQNHPLPSTIPLPSTCDPIFSHCQTFRFISRI